MFLVISLWGLPESILMYLILPLMMLSLYFASCQLVNMLLTLELIVLFIFLTLTLKSNVALVSTSFLVVYMCIMVCEAMVGIGLLISLVRTKGNNSLPF